MDRELIWLKGKKKSLFFHSVTKPKFKSYQMSVFIVWKTFVRYELLANDNQLQTLSRVVGCHEKRVCMVVKVKLTRLDGKREDRIALR